MPRSYKPIQLIWNYTPVLKPMPAADLPQSVDEEPAVCVRLSNKLVPYLLGLLEMYRWEDKLTGTPQEVIDGLGLFQDLLVVLTEGNCTGDNMAFKLRQNPLNACQLQQSTDGGVTWTLAFDYSRCVSPSETITQLAIIQDLINTYGPDIPINPFDSETSLTGSQIGREILACPLAKWIVETYAETVRITIESRNDGQEAWKVALLGLVGAVVSIAAALATGGISLGVSATTLSFMGAGMGAGAAAGGLVLLADLTAPLTDEQKEALTCCVKEAIETNFTRAGLSSIACADVPSEHLAAFNEIMAKPETWAGIVQAANEPLDGMPSGCCGDEGCVFINLRYPVLLGAHTDRLDGYLTTHNRNPPNLNTSATVKKLLYAKFKLPAGFRPKSIAFDAYVTSTYFASGTPKTKAYFDAVLGGSIYAYETTTLAGHQTYTKTFDLLGDPTAEYLIIEIEVANHNGYYLTGWNNAKAILRAVKVCGEFIV